MFLLTGLVTLLAVLAYFLTGVGVARARSRYNVKAPATSGDPAFERAFRVQQNMLEWMPLFLPSLWLFAFYLSDVWAAAIGLIWIGGRLLYARDYAAAAEARGRGFAIQAMACGALFVGAAARVLWLLVHG